MTILITGGTGFIGQTLIHTLLKKNYSIRLLTRNPKKYTETLGKDCELLYWDCKNIPDKDAYKNCHTIINLCGESIAASRWTASQKQKLRDSRILSTKALVEGAKKYSHALDTLISSSAIGYYDHKKNKPLNESTEAGAGFLSTLCKDWEEEAKAISHNSTIRECRIRTGLVLGNGGALKKMLPPFKLGLGGRLGSGKQWMNWIHVQDLVNLIVFLIENPEYNGPYNAVAPQNCDNTSFTKALGAAIKRPTLFPVPGFALKLALGELASILLDGQPCSSKKCQEAGFVFQYPTLNEALTQALS